VNFGTFWKCPHMLTHLQSKKKTKQNIYPSQLAYKHYCKLFGCWSLGIMEHFPWMKPLYQCEKVPPFHLDGVWPSSSKFTNNMGNKLVNKIGHNTMVTSIERTHFERGSHLVAFMFHSRWCPSRASCNQIQHTIYLHCSILFCIVLFLGAFF
jgi:hypothetical protein